MANPPIEVKITGDASGLTKAAGIAQGSLAKLQAQMGSLETLSAKGFSFSGLAGIGLSATAAAAALVGAVKSAADYGDQLDNMSKRTGITVEELSKLQYAASLSDTSTEALGKGLSYLSNILVAAANGAEDSGKLFEKFGISLRKADGTVRGTSEVLLDLADVFSTLPDGTEKSALAAELFGKKLGQELIPLLNEGRAGLKAMGDEAERLGLVLNKEQAAAAAEFNDNLDRLAALSKGAAASIGNALLPVINQYIAKLNDANNSGLGFWDRLAIGQNEAAIVGKKSTADMIADLEKLKAKRDSLNKTNLTDGGSVDTSAIDAEVQALERRVAYSKLQNERTEGDDKASAAKRLIIAAQLQRETARLEQLKGIAAGKVSADILKDDTARTAEQIKNAEKLRDALRSAWEASRKEAETAGQAAKNLFEKAAGVRLSAADKANELRDGGLSDEEKQANNLSRAQAAQQEGSFYAAAAGAAQLDGRAKDFEKYQKQAELFLDRAQKFAEKAGDANAVEEIGGQQAGLIEQQAKAKLTEQATLEQRAASQADLLKQLDADIEALTTKAANIEIKADIAQATGAVATLQAELDKLQDKTVTVTVNTVKSGEAAPAPQVLDLSSYGQGYASGGMIRGPGTGTSDSILARVSNQEYIVKAAAVRHYGADLMHRINSMQIPKFAEGGLVGGSNPAGGAPLVLDFGKLGRFKASTAGDTAKEIERVFKRASLSFGRS